IHLALGVSGLIEALSGDGSALLPALYLLGGLAALGLLGVIAPTPVTTTAYAAGPGLMALFVLAYADVHALGVAESALGIEVHDHGDHAHGHGGHDGEGHSHDHGDEHDHNGEGHSHDHDDGHGHSHDGHDHAGEGHSHDHDDGHGHDDHDHDGDGDAMTVLAEHLRDDAYALVSKTAEASALALFTVLALLDR
ncbi:MAG: hypothetical protein QXG03_04795, partial [Halalkalicoccus sp.]